MAVLLLAIVLAMTHAMPSLGRDEAGQTPLGNLVADLPDSQYQPRSYTPGSLKFSTPCCPLQGAVFHSSFEQRLHESTESALTCITVLNWRFAHMLN